ncbi:DUF1617 family protein [Shouchella clausii]|uniref:DUF1617 family protein n=1 Tax=Shouchella TaxID=2893057 RepID=UPI000BA68B51|nr:DUF1617 family protein [Shouchella clausii]PAE92485.1 hypothetical protein CHH70_14675 [Shouchella clausii]
MKIEIENAKLIPIINFMYDLKLVRKESRFRRRFINLLSDRAKLVEEERKEILETYAVKDEQGKAVIEDGNYKIENMHGLAEETQELLAEKLVIEGGDNYELLKVINDILNDLVEEPYEGQTSEIYDYLCEQFEPVQSGEVTS